MTFAMKATARTILSATTALGLVAFTVISAAAGAPATVPATGLGLLAVYGLVEMMIRSYAPRRYVARPAVRPVPAARITVARVPALVEFPVVAPRRARVLVRAA